MDRPRIGVIGLGKMGAPMARRLLAAGYPVVVHDIRPDAAAALLPYGASAGDSAARVAALVDVVVTMLPDGEAVRRVTYGDGGLATALMPGQLFIEMTSSDPEVTRRIAGDLSPRGIRMLDAPVSGGVSGATEGTLCIMVGGPGDVLEACRPILECLGRTIVHVGPACGDGDTAKTINNFLSATTLWSAAEAMVLGARAGLAREKLLEAINSSTGRSHTTEVKLPRYTLKQHFASGFTIGQYAKDLDICLAVARRLGVPMVVGSRVHEAWKAAVAQGAGEVDHTALAALLERRMPLDAPDRQ